MDIKSITTKVPEFIKKYKVAIIVLLLGFVLVSISDIQDREIVAEPESIATPEIGLSEQLEQILSQIDGAGKVKVLISVATGEKILYQSDESISTNESGNNIKKDTVTVTDEERSQSGLVVQKNPPTYLGAIVLCEGAEDPAVKLSIVEAVSKATGLRANEISVLKMK